MECFSALFAVASSLKYCITVSEVGPSKMVLAFPSYKIF